MIDFVLEMIWEIATKSGDPKKVGGAQLWGDMEDEDPWNKPRSPKKERNSLAEMVEEAQRKRGK